MAEEVASLQTDLDTATKQAALAQYAQLIADLQMIDLNLVVGDKNSRQAIQNVCTLLTKEYSFDKSMVEDALAELEKLS